MSGTPPPEPTPEQEDRITRAEPRPFTIPPYAIRVEGFGPFRIPGERDRWERARHEAMLLQRHRGLPVDGMVGRETWWKMTDAPWWRRALDRVRDRVAGWRR